MLKVELLTGQIKVTHRWTDGPLGDLIRVPFFPFEVLNSKI